MGRLSPEWRGWLELLERTHRASEDPVWGAAVPEPAAGRPEGAPLLHGAVVRLDGRVARRWVRSLVKAAARRGAEGGASLGRLRARRLDGPALIEAAVAHDHARVEALAAEAGADPHAVGVVAQLAARPLLLSCGRALAARVPPAWDRGWCPVCGAWPVLAEMRGIERARRLRCGRCGGDWGFSVLHCPFCGERDHARLAGLVPEGEEETRRVDACRSCRGYVKTVATLGALPGEEVARRELEEVELDLAAVERGYGRPQRPGYAVRLGIVDSGRVAAGPGPPGGGTA